MSQTLSTLVHSGAPPAARVRAGRGACLLLGLLLAPGLVLAQGSGGAPGTPRVTDEGDYARSTNTLSASWTADDPRGLIREYQYRLTRGATDGALVRDWTSVNLATSVMSSGLSLAAGETYYFAVRARYGASQLTPNGYSDGVIADGVPPVLTSALDDGQYTLISTWLHARWQGSDTGSGVARYRYAIGTSPGATDVRAWRNVNLDLEVTATGLTLANGASYWFTVEISDRAGNTATRSTDGIMVDTAAPSVMNLDDDAYTRLTTSLSASWTGADAESGIRGYDYSIGRTPGAIDVKPWTSVGTHTTILATGLALTHGSTYYVNVKARDLAGNSRIVSSDGVTVDAVLPTVSVQDDGAVTTNGTRLRATWTGSDAGSQIAEYQYALGTPSDPQALVPWTSRNLQTSVTVSGLALGDGVTYFFHVQAIDGAGNVAAASSDGIRADLAAPVVSFVSDGGAYQADATSLSANWLATDAGGISEYRYAVGTSPAGTNVVPWTSAGLERSVAIDGLALRNGRSYYFSVRAFDAADRMGSGQSDGIMVDLETPTMGAVVDAGEYTRDPGSLSFSYSASDDESGIRAYSYAIGTPDDIQSVVPWTSVGLATSQTVSGLQLEDGVVYLISVSASDQVGNTASAFSDGIRPDTTPPTIVFLEDTGTVTALNDRLSASWHATDAGAGISSYRYAIGTAPDSDDVFPWTDPGSETSVTVTGLSLVPGVSYYFTLRVIDLVGLLNSAHTDGIQLDAAPPAIGDISVDAITGTTATVRWATDKPTEGIVDFGETTAYGARADDYGFAESHAVILNLLTPGTPYYYRITATDDAGTVTTSDDLTFTTRDEADRHVRISPANSSYVDPDVLQSEGKLTFRLGNGDVWVGDLDRAAGGFVKTGGRDYRMDTASETGSSVDGPQFGVDAAGWAVYYSKQDQGAVQVWGSRWTDDAAAPAVLTSGTAHHSVMPNRGAYSQVRLVDIIGSWDAGGDLAWYAEGSPDAQHTIAPADAESTNRDPGHWMDDGIRLVMVDPDSGQLFTLNTSNDQRVAITNDGGYKTGAQGWQAPEYDGETIVAAVVDDDAIAIYRNLGPRFWTRVSTLPIPIASNNTVISAPRPFVAGDRSYIALEIKDRPTSDGDADDGEIWVFDLEDDALTRYAQRCDEGRPDLARSHPAVLVSEHDVFVYYNVAAPGGVTELWVCRTGIAVNDEHPIVDTDVGRLQGERRAGADSFLSIPFAVPPVNELRWRATEPVAAWSDVRVANRLPPPCPQPDAAHPDSAIIGEEDCLYLNVWAPSDRTPGLPLPVMVFVHGGGNRRGGASEPLSSVLNLDDNAPLYDGAELAERGDVVVVTLQYRLAALGFLADAALAAGSETGTAGNYGVLDLLEALRWIQRNATAFGGDPSRVLLFGQSGGARDVSILMASPLAAGLFSRALMESGVMEADTPQEAQEDADAFVAEMGLTGDPDLAARLRELPLWEIVLADSALPVDGGDSRFDPHIDGYVLSASPLDIVTAGAHNAVPFIIGTNAAELANEFHDLTLDELNELAAALVPAERLAELYTLYPLRDFASPTEAYVAMSTDQNYTSTARLLARVMREHQALPVYRYHFRRVLSTNARAGDGAYHASELLYVFQHMDGVRFSATEDDRAVETLLLDYWTRFAASGDPNNPGSPAWPVYDTPSDPYMILDVNAASATQLFQERCDFWDSVRSELQD